MFGIKDLVTSLPAAVSKVMFCSRVPRFSASTFLCDLFQDSEDLLLAESTSFHVLLLSLGGTASLTRLFYRGQANMAEGLFDWLRLLITPQR